MADGVTLLPALVKKFHDLHPDALVHLDAGYEPGLVKKLKDGDLDKFTAEQVASAKKFCDDKRVEFDGLMDVAKMLASN